MKRFGFLALLFALATAVTAAWAYYPDTVQMSGDVTIDNSGVTTIKTGVSLTFADVDAHTNGTVLTAAQVSRTFVNNYGQNGAATITLPAAAAGYTFVAIVGTQYNAAWKIQRGGSDTIYWDSGGTITAGKTYFQETNQAIGSRVSCGTFRTGASAYSWLCTAVTGTWVTD